MPVGFITIENRVISNGNSFVDRIVNHERTHKCPNVVTGCLLFILHSVGRFFFYRSKHKNSNKIAGRGWKWGFEQFNNASTRGALLTNTCWYHTPNQCDMMITLREG